MGLPTLKQVVGWCVVLCLGASLGGCGTLGLGGARPITIDALASEGPTARLSVPQTTAVFRESEGVIDLIVTDLTAEQLRQLASDAPDFAPTGVIIHAHMFLKPHAGRTPISFTASNAAFSMLVLAGPDAGIYGGGGFLLPSAMTPASFSARTREATLRLVGQTGGFIDQIGSGELRGSIRARADVLLTEDGLRLIAGAMQQLSPPER
ncbi:MAG: hypothetical protein KDA20_03945 [Phycisphaerales bacterium]|nr:hypothetical protein [Phycisphaerales bacterium]